jgi:hypothetical protein
VYRKSRVDFNRLPPTVTYVGMSNSLDYRWDHVLMTCSEQVLSCCHPTPCTILRTMLCRRWKFPFCISLANRIAPDPPFPTHSTCSFIYLFLNRRSFDLNYCYISFFSLAGIIKRGRSISPLVRTSKMVSFRKDCISCPFARTWWRLCLDRPAFSWMRFVSY